MLAAQARRETLDGSVDEAIEHWRQAVGNAIHEGRTDDAGSWLYAISTASARYEPWTNRSTNEEHLLAQALPKSTSGRLIRRVSDPETDARRAALDGHPHDAVHAARRWLADSIVLGDWVDEEDAAELLGDLYARNSEPERAATCYQWAGNTKKLAELAAVVGDRLLPSAHIDSGAWWQQASCLASMAEQHDLLDDDTAGRLLSALLDLAARGRAGELTDSPTHSLTLQTLKTVCTLAGRGTSNQAQAFLDQFAGDVARSENHYRHWDKEHVQACQAIALYHEELTWPALVRVFDLAEAGTHDALAALRSPLVLKLLREPRTGTDDTSPETPGPPRSPSLTGQQRLLLQERLQAMAAAGRYDAGLAIAMLGGVDPGVTDRASQARDRLLGRPEPDGHTVSFGTQMTSDAYLVSLLDADDQQACLNKMLTVASDRREAALNRQEALTAASNLALKQSDQIKAAVHARSRAFVDGGQDGSFLEAETTNPHPLSWMRINFGSGSLRAGCLRLALCTATKVDDRIWVRDRAILMLISRDNHLVREGAVTLSQLGADVIADLDATMLAGHSLPVVRQLAAAIATAAPAKYARTLKTLASDPDSTVRVLLAHRLHRAIVRVDDTSAGTSERGEPDIEREADGHAISEALAVLAKDKRHAVRRAAAGLDS